MLRFRHEQLGTKQFRSDLHIKSTTYEDPQSERIAQMVRRLFFTALLEIPDIHIGKIPSYVG